MFFLSGAGEVVSIPSTVPANSPPPPYSRFSRFLSSFSFARSGEGTISHFREAAAGATVTETERGDPSEL